MAAQVILDLRCEPAQIEIAIGTRNNKSGLAVPVLSRDFLHDVISGKSGKDADSRRIAAKELICECINVVIRNCHGVVPYPLGIGKGLSDPIESGHRDLLRADPTSTAAKVARIKRTTRSVYR
jgi:hypothetical protein